MQDFRTNRSPKTADHDTTDGVAINQAINTHPDNLIGALAYILADMPEPGSEEDTFPVSMSPQPVFKGTHLMADGESHKVASATLTLTLDDGRTHVFPLIDKSGYWVIG